MKEYSIRSIHFDQNHIQRVIGLLDMYIDIAIENKPDETAVEDIGKMLMDICKDIFQKRYANE